MSDASTIGKSTADPLPTPDRLLDLLEAMEGRRIAMVGDLLADRFLSGTPQRISREAPVLILRLDEEKVVPGGGGNAIANVAALGGRPSAFGVVGDDEVGSVLKRQLQERGVEVGGIEKLAGFRTPTKTRVLAGGRHTIKQQIVRYDIEDAVPGSFDLGESWLERIGALASDAAMVVLSDYGYGSAPPSLLPGLRRHLPGVPILGDSRYRLRELRGLDGATPNLEEAELLLGGSLEGDDDLEQGGQRLRREFGWGLLLVTRGSAGMSLFTEHEACHLPIHGSDQVVDVTGAGDTVISALALALAAGATPLEAACLANYAGGVVVMKTGTATLDRAELAAAVRRDPELPRAIRRQPFRS